MLTKKTLYRLLFSLFLTSIAVVFYFERPLNSPWHRFIAGDGLGYYSYLPATFIYEDKNYEFKWFNAVFEKHYINFSGGSADDNFLVNYQGKRVNKYYPGLSFLWMPFFLLAHAVACVLQFPADGYSVPYQWGMALASLFYLFLGLYYLRKLAFRLSGRAWIALLIPLLIFYGTDLFHYALNQNTLSHVYSFTLMVMFIYYSHKFFNEEDHKLLYLLSGLVLGLLIVCIRPMNGLAVLLLPGLVNTYSWPPKKSWGRFSWQHVLLLVITLWLLTRQFFILKHSTGSFFPDTYAGESFNFFKPHLWKVSFGYQMGIFLYSPVLLFSLFGVPYLKHLSQKILFPLFLFFLLYIYSCWWFWPITLRALIDFYAVPAILLTVLASRFDRNRNTAFLFIFLSLMLCAYHQLKSIQFRNGVLDESYTYREHFWKNFFRLKRSYQYPIDPQSILKSSFCKESFEDPVKYTGTRSNAQCKAGAYSAVLDAGTEYTKAFNCPVPDFFLEPGIARIRCSFYCRAEEKISNFQVVVTLYDKDNKTLLYLPYYVKKEALCYGDWTDMEFGYEFSPEQTRQMKPAYLSIFVWNHEHADRLYLDELKAEFLLCDRSCEIVP